MDGGERQSVAKYKKSYAGKRSFLHVWSFSTYKIVTINYRLLKTHKLPSDSRGAYRRHMYLSERIKFFRITELMDVYGRKVCRESLVAAEFAFSDGDEEVNDCAFAKFVNA